MILIYYSKFPHRHPDMIYAWASGRSLFIDINDIIQNLDYTHMDKYIFRIYRVTQIKMYFLKISLILQNEKCQIWPGNDSYLH